MCVNQWYVCYSTSTSTIYTGGRTKCQPDKMPTNVWILFCGWHFVRTIPTFFGPLSESWKMSSCLIILKVSKIWVCRYHGVIRLVWWVLMMSYVSVFKWSRFFWQTSGSTGGTGGPIKLSFTGPSIRRLDLPLRATRPWKSIFSLVILY